MTRVVDDIDLFSKLLNSIKVSTKDRPLCPIEVSDLILRMNIECSSEQEVMERLDIKKDIFKAFKLLQDLPEEYKGAVVWGSTNEEGISFSSAHQIARMKSTESEKKILLQSAIQYQFSKNEIANITTLKNRERNMPIDECIEKVKRIRPSIEVHHLIVIPMKHTIIEKLKGIVSLQNVKIDVILKNFVSKFINNEDIFSIVVKDSYAILSLNKNGYLRFMEVRKQNKLLINELIEFFVNNGEKLSVT